MVDVQFEILFETPEFSYWCTTCGAVVVSTEIHREWHRRSGDTQ